MKKKDNLIHIRFEYAEAVESKKDLLSLEVEFLRAIKTIERYKKLRMQELKLKLALKRKVGGALIAINQLQRAFPKVQIPQIIKHKSTIEHDEISHVSDDKLEDELRMIQDKLKNLQFE